MGLNQSILNQLMVSVYDGRVTTPAPDRQTFNEFSRKEFRSSDIAELFHERTQLTESTGAIDDSTVSLFLNDDAMAFAQQRLQPDYPGAETIELPPPRDDLDGSLSDVIESRRSRRSYAGEGVSLQKLATLLHYSCGVTHRSTTADEGPLSEVESRFRTYPSGGGLYPVEPYVAVMNGTDTLERGLYYYVPAEHALRKLAEGTDEFRTAVVDSFVGSGDPSPRDSAFCLILTAAFWRSKAKYGPRGYRFVLQESGHLMQNALLAATALGLASIPFASVREKRLEDVLDVNGVDESVIYTGLFGVPDGDGGDADE